MSAEGKGKRPYKVWDSGRQVRKGLVVASFTELIEKGREKLQLGEVRIKVVLEADGTQVEDPEYFYTLPENTVFLLLRQGEHWYPAGTEVLRQAITAIPKIVCETIYSLGLHDEAPVWKIMDQYGKITVVLSWDPSLRGDQRHAPSSSSPRKPSATATRMIVSGVGESAIQRHEYQLLAHPSISSTPSPAPLSMSGTKSPVPPAAGAGVAPSGPAPHGTVTTILRDGKKETLINDIGPSVVSSTPASLPAVHKAVAATSPIQEGERRPGHHMHPSQSPCSKALAPPPPAAGASAATASAAQTQKGVSHVRFLADYRSSVEKERTEQESSESETENTTNDEEAHTSEKFLLLIDQLSVDTKKHLSIKDIGVILDRLSSKIIDVEKLDREIEEEDCFNWTIKATIRGDSLRELGVIYNGHYYSISEHPGYGEKKEEEEDQAEDKDAEKEPV